MTCSTSCCIDSRGVGGSTGSPSWTGNDEVEDLREIVRHSYIYKGWTGVDQKNQVQWGLKSYPEATEVLLVVRAIVALTVDRHTNKCAKHRVTPMAH
jgi:hypothetical protein